jgi:hypothetical protein
MAKQSSFIKLNGRVGGLSFYKTKDGHFAREKGGVAKSRIMNDASFARTRENLREFHENVKAVKLLLDTIRPATIKIADSRIYQRMVKQMMLVLRTDPVSNRGDRKVKLGDWTLLGGIELNGKASLGSTFKVEYAISDSPTAWSIAIPEFLPADFLLIPSGTTHYRIFVAAAGLDFDSGERSFLIDSSTEMEIKQLSPAFNLNLEKASLPGTHRVYILGLEFLQVVNGQVYSLNNGTHNAAALVMVENQ